MELSELESLVEKGKQLQQLLSDTPEILTMLELLKETKVENMVVPVKADKLIGTTEAIGILKVSEVTFRSYWKRGLLGVYYTPDSHKKKFWLSEVMAIPRKEVIA